MEFGKIADNELVLRPKVVHLNGVAYSSPDAAICLACDEGPFYKVNRRSRTAAPLGYHWTSKRTGWEIAENEIWGLYESEKDTPPVTRYSGWKMYKAIKAEGYGAAFNELMKNNIEVMIAFVRPQYFLSDDADFTAMVTQMCAALHIDDAAKERILAASVDEEVH